MARLRSFAILLLSAAIAATVAGIALRDNAPPHATLLDLSSPEVIDVGLRRYGEDAPYLIPLQNTNESAPLRIDSLTSSCSCTTTNQAPFEIAAGEAHELRGVFSLRETAYTPVASTSAHEPTVEFADTVIRLRSNDQSRRITIHATLVSPLVPDTPTDEAHAAYSLHPMYHDYVSNVAFFSAGGADPLPMQTTTSTRGYPIYLITTPPNATALESVIELRPSNAHTGPGHRLVQSLALARTEQPGAHPDLSRNHVSRRKDQP